MKQNQTTTKRAAEPRSLPLVDTGATVMLLALFSAALVTSMSMSFRAGLMPRFAAVLGLAATALYLVVLIVVIGRRSGNRSRGATGNEAATSGAPETEDVSDVEHSFATASRRRWLIATASIAAFFALLYVAGVYVTALAFSLGYLKSQANRSWLFAAVYSVILGGVLYLTFDAALAVDVPSGLLDLH